MAPRFFKVILQRSIDSKKLELPTKFTREHGHELSDAAQLVVADGRIWRVELSREGGRISLSNGFHELARHYSLNHGHELGFKYKGVSCFSVAIFDRTGCEIPYPSQRSTPPEIPTPAHFRSERPHFRVKLSRCNFMENRVIIPRATAESIPLEQVEKRAIWLEAGTDGRRWKASLGPKSYGRKCIGSLMDFYEDNGLKENDICIFEVAQEDLLKVLIFA